MLNYRGFYEAAGRADGCLCCLPPGRAQQGHHFIGVPVIVLSLFIPLAWLRVDIGGDVPLGLVMLGLFIVLGWIGDRIAALGPVQGWTWFAVLFVGGWILQLVGYVYEGRRPALADNLFQIFVAPIFLAAEVFFALGDKSDLRKRVEISSAAHRAPTAPST